MSAQELLSQAAAKNTELLRGLHETEDASSALQQSQAYLDDLDREIRECDAQVKQFEAKTRTELEDHKKYAESSARRFMHRAVGKKEKFAEKASKEEREYVEALFAETQAKSRRAEWIKNRDEARKHHAQLENADMMHQKLQAELDALYNSVFSGPSPDFLGEDEKEWTFREAKDAFNNAKRNHEAEVQAVKCLENAQQFMSQALQHLAEARSHSRTDMFGSTWSDMMEREALSKAQNATDKVKMLVEQAQRLSSAVQRLGNLEIPHGHVISDILFNEVFDDMTQHNEIKESQAQAERETRTLQEMVAKTQQRSDQLQQEENAALARLETSRKELQQIRQGAFERLAHPPAYDQVPTTV
ncbi:MAG: hypothetical protein Q9184_003844 [Pyrenodesmia sp. 2 TL-2023]